MTTVLHAEPLEEKRAVCYSCEAVLSYTQKDIIMDSSINYDGGPMYWDALVCPHCGKRTPCPQPPSTLTDKLHDAVATGVMVLIIAGLAVLAAFIGANR
jgi:hypothetical protein